MVGFFGAKFKKNENTGKSEKAQNTENKDEREEISTNLADIQRNLRV